VLFCGLLCFVLPGAALGQGMGGLPSDRLDWSGSPTDRYLEPSEIRTVLHDATETFYECFREHVRGGAAADQVAVTFRVPRSGRADQVVVELGHAPAGLGPCVEATVQGLDFGDHDGDPVEASYPLVYQVDRGGARVLPYPVVFTRPRVVRLPLLLLPADITPGEVRLLERVFTQDERPSEAEEAPAGSTATQEPEPASPGAAEPADGEPSGEK